MLLFGKNIFHTEKYTGRKAFPSEKVIIVTLQKIVFGQKDGKVIPSGNVIIVTLQKLSPAKRWKGSNCYNSKIVPGQKCNK
jgi:hypothetical protein